MSTDPGITEVFSGLPETLVEDLLKKTDDMSSKLLQSFTQITNDSSKIRKILEKDLKRDTDIVISKIHPTTCGVDGSYASPKLLSTDIVGIAGVALSKQY